MSSFTLQFAHISDTHFGPTENFTVSGVNPVQRTRALVRALNALPVRLDFVMHSGDVTNEPLAEAYRIAERELSQIQYPRYYVSGNHDLSSLIISHLSIGPRRILEGSGEGLHYVIDVGGARCIVVDAVPGREPKHNGHLSSQTLQAIDDELHRGSSPVLLFIHYPVTSLNCTWIDTSMHLENGEELHQILRRCASSVRGVFYGHIHQHFHSVRDGVLYSGVGALSFAMRGFPEDSKYYLEPNTPPSFQVVSVSEREIVVQHYPVV